MYQAAAQGTVDVISAFTTDGRIVAFDLKVVDDDRGVIPPYDAIVLGNGRFVRDHPTLARSLRALDGTIDANHMRRMNLEVDEKKRAPADVAREFMRELPDEQ
jgi:osmoprotectant transport system permease protein